MDQSFSEAYKRLNGAQKQAVDTIDGPLLVIAGPGTGKTQLLSTRAAKIAATGNVNASNILCLTFTETGAAEMRSRLVRVMGLAGSEVAVHTFHSFGTWLIGQYPEQFSTERALQPLDDLSRYRVFEELLSALPLRHQLAVRGDGDSFIRRHAVEEAIRAFKQAGLSPAALRASIRANKQTFTTLQPLLDELFGSTLSAKRLPAIAELVASYAKEAAPGSLQAILLHGLGEAVIDSQAAGKTAPIGSWRTEHTVIKGGHRVFKSQAGSEVLNDTIDLYEQYQARLAVLGRYDYEDMIIWASGALEANEDMRLDVAERFQYIMVDEYQDTNGAQNRLLDSILQANPLNSPNVMVVGDDDQAIMRFQGAEASGMFAFVHAYSPTMVVLTENYRSSQQILDAARQIMMQTSERLEVTLPEYNLQKQLHAQNEPSKTAVKHLCYDSPAVQHEAIAEQIAQLLKQGVPATEIAVIGRKHASLAEFVPYLASRDIATNYDRHEDILTQPHISQLLELADCIARIVDNPRRAERSLPHILAANYWQLAPLDIYRLAATARENKTGWLDTMLESTVDQWPPIAEWLIAAANASQTHNFTQFFDILIGRTPLPDTTLEYSPFKTYLDESATDSYITLLSHLICLRSAVLESRPNATGLSDLLEVAAEYRASDLRLIDNNPVLKGDAAGVQVMSAHGSKGREFDYVFILSALDNVWGAKARSQSQRVRLPENLPLYQAGDADSDRLRLLYVCMTRARSHLTIASYTATDAGKPAAALSYLQLGDDSKGWWQPQPQALAPANRAQTLETAWSPIVKPSHRSLKEVLQPLLATYRLSASGLRSFLDICYAGPVACIEQSVLGFPSAHNSRSALGSAAHKALEALYRAHASGEPLSHQALLHVFDEKLTASGLTDLELASVREHGHQFLPIFADNFTAHDLTDITATEQFLTANLPGNDVPLSGFIDALKQTEDGIAVIDYKTGRPPLPDWKTTGLSDSKKLSQHFYRQQLLFYKLLIDNSTLYSVPATHAELIFVEPNETGDFIRLHINDFDPAELERTAQLVAAVYSRIKEADLPDISAYSQDLKGVLQFEADLLGE
jgi:DNA helicase-2/ATP-dependent DNA helicase PcrA